MSATASATSEAATSAQGISAKVIEQVVHYLSASNLQRDLFLAAKLREGGGFVPAAMLAGFPRIKSILEDTGAVCNILWNSSEFNCKGQAAVRVSALDGPLRLFNIACSIWRSPVVTTDSGFCHAHWTKELRRYKTRQTTQGARQNVLCSCRPSRP